jgi:hypothetical protein
LARYRLLRPYLRQEVLEETLAEVSLDAEEKDAARRQFLADHGLDGDGGLQAYRARHRLSLADLDYQIAYPVKVWK